MRPIQTSQQNQTRYTRTEPGPSTDSRRRTRTRGLARSTKASEFSWVVALFLPRRKHGRIVAAKWWNLECRPGSTCSNATTAAVDLHRTRSKAGRGRPPLAMHSARLHPRPAPRWFDNRPRAGGHGACGSAHRWSRIVPEQLGGNGPRPATCPPMSNATRPKRQRPWAAKSGMPAWAAAGLRAAGCTCWIGGADARPGACEGRASGPARHGSRLD
jgi:hypothetical protein